MATYYLAVNPSTDVVAWVDDSSGGFTYFYYEHSSDHNLSHAIYTNNTVWQNAANRRLSLESTTDVISWE